MIHSIPTYVYYLGAIVLSAVISAYSIKKIIFIARNHKIYDVPDDTRKIHGAEIPTLGGIGIFIGYVLVSAFLWPKQLSYMPYVLISSVILFFTGIYDDIMNMRPSKKLAAQLVASFIAIYFIDNKLESQHGLFDIEVIPFWPGIIVATLCCTFFINVFNFVDGIDGLAAVLAILYLGILGLMFAATFHFALAGISFSLMGATFGLLCYNISPAKIYMGDTGSMVLGFTIFILSLLFICIITNPGFGLLRNYFYGIQEADIMLAAMLYLPVFDAIRVFILRASRGISPLKADRTHLHYYLLDAGFTHTRSVTIIVGINILLMAAAFLLQDMSPYIVLLTITVISLAALYIIYRLRSKHMKKTAS